MWKPQINYFNKNYKVLAINLPGFGKSGKMKSCDSIECIAKTWFVKEDKAKYFCLCTNAGKETSLEAADNGLNAMKK